MTEQTQATDSGAAEVTETLDDVISSYVPPQVQVQTQAPAQPVNEPTSIDFDPLDENSAKSFARTVVHGQDALRSQIRELSDKLTHYEQREAESRIETDINKAVGAINDGLNLDKDVVRTYLELTARNKPQFKQIWDNRHNDPKTFQRALGALRKEIGNKFSARQDHELTETQAAIQQSQRAMASKSTEKTVSSAEEALAKAGSQAEFDRVWRSMLG